MELLAINTSTRYITIAHRINHTTIITKTHESPLSLSEILPVMLQELLQESDPSHASVTVCIGPGSYTSLRIGITLAKMLTLSFNTPLIGLRSSLIYSHLVNHPLAAPLLVVLETQRKLFWIEKFLHSPLQTDIPPQLASAHDIQKILSGHTHILVGDGIPRLLLECPHLQKQHTITNTQQQDLVHAQFNAALSLIAADPNSSNSLEKKNALKPIYFNNQHL